LVLHIELIWLLLILACPDLKFSKILIFRPFTGVTVACYVCCYYNKLQTNGFEIGQYCNADYYRYLMGSNRVWVRYRNVCSVFGCTWFFVVWSPLFINIIIAHVNSFLCMLVAPFTRKIKAGNGQGVMALGPSWRNSWLGNWEIGDLLTRAFL